MFKLLSRKSPSPPLSSFHLQSSLQLSTGSPLSPSNNVLTGHNACTDLQACNLLMKYKQRTAKNLQTAAKDAHLGNMREVSAKSKPDES